MEERVGLWWHRVVSRAASRDHAAAAVEFADVARRIPLWFRALGGDPGVAVQAGGTTESGHARSWLQRLAGTGGRAALAWVDERALRLPPGIALYAERELNRDLYYWQAALAAVGLRPGLGWAEANQEATVRLLAAYPALRPRYRRLVEAELGRRPDPASLPEDEARRERAIRDALVEPGSVAALPRADRAWFPVAPWLHPDPPRDLGSGAAAPAEGGGAANTVGGDKRRRAARRAPAPQKRGGIFLPRPETIMSWDQYAPVDVQPDDEQAPTTQAADDLDHLQVSAERGACAKALRMDLDLTPGADATELPGSGVLLLPEWDHRRRVLVPERCALRELAVPETDGGAPFPDHLKRQRRRLRASFAAMAPQRERLRAQPDGPELDLDRCLLARTGGDPDGRMHVAWTPRRRDLACLLLADLSLSTEAALDAQRRVIDVIRDGMVLFADTLDHARDRFAVYGFSSRGRGDVRLDRIKAFGEDYGGRTRARIASVSPGGYTRMGAALRGASRILARQDARQRLLLLLTDGKPNDNDAYEGRHGVEDTRHAFHEARRSGLQAFCVTIDQDAQDYLPHLFGRGNFAIVRDAAELPTRLTLLYARLARA